MVTAFSISTKPLRNDVHAKMKYKQGVRTDTLRVSLVILFQLLRDGFSIILRDLNYTIHSSYSNGAELFTALLANEVPDIVIIDVDKPDAGAIDTVARLKDHHPSVKVLALSIEGNESVIKPVLDRGAVGYILKTIDQREMRTALKKLATKGYYFGPGQIPFF
jgi:DNA-binding NarL/FixJ family response regulator